MIYKAQHWKLQNEQCKTTGVNSGAPEGCIIPDSLIAPVVLRLLQTGDKSMHNGNNENPTVIDLLGVKSITLHSINHVTLQWVLEYDEKYLSSNLQVNEFHRAVGTYINT